MPNLLICATVNPSTHEVATHFGVGEIFIRSFTNEHFIEYDSNAPYVTFCTVNVLPIAFRTHISWGTYVIKQLWLLCFIQKLAKSKISDSRPCIGEENVCSL